MNQHSWHKPEQMSQSACVAKSRAHPLKVFGKALALAGVLVGGVIGCGGAVRQIPSTAASEVRSPAESESVFRVRVEVREVRNRIVVGQIRNHRIFIDQPRQFGADDTAPTPPETLAFAVGSCLVSTGRLMAMQRKMDVKALEVVVEGDLDFAKALGASSKKRAGFRGLTLTLNIEANLTPSQKAAFLEEIRSRCPMCDNLTSPTPLVFKVRP